MTTNINTTLIGGFIVGAIALVIIAILALGGGNLFQKADRYVLYFSGSVKGLSVGAPVQLKGIDIGRVVDINPIYNATDSSFLNQVIFEVPERIVQITGVASENGPPRKLLTTDTTIDYMIDKGLRAKLQLQSVLTGQLLVAFDFYPDTPIEMMRFDDNLREYPTLPSEMETLARTFDTIDFQAIAKSINVAAKGINRLVSSPDLSEALVGVNTTINRYGQLAVHLDDHAARLTTEMVKTLAAARTLINTGEKQLIPIKAGFTETAARVQTSLANLDRRLAPMMEHLATTVESARDAIQQAAVILDNLSQLSGNESSLIYQIDTTMTELKKAASAMAVMADYLSRHPEALLWGKKEVASHDEQP